MINELQKFNIDDPEVRELLLDDLIPITEGHKDSNELREVMIDYVISYLNYYMDLVNKNYHLIAKRNN